MSEIKVWLKNEVKAAEMEEVKAEALVEMARASERSGLVQEWRAAKSNAKCARQLLAAVEVGK